MLIMCIDDLFFFIGVLCVFNFGCVNGSLDKFSTLYGGYIIRELICYNVLMCDLVYEEFIIMYLYDCLYYLYMMVKVW